jgi:hypothetical protein
LICRFCASRLKSLELTATLVQAAVGHLTGAVEIRLGLCAEPSASDIRKAYLGQSVGYHDLSLENIGQRYAIFSCPINYLCANAMQATNQGVGSSNLSGRAN